MRCLLDTSVLYWWIFFPELLSSQVRGLLCNADTQAFVSSVSAYEMSHEHHRGRWPEVAPLVNAFEATVVSEGFALLPLSAGHATLAGAFPAEHRDPIDRLLAAQATVESLVFLSEDKGIGLLGVEPVWTDVS